MAGREMLLTFNLGASLGMELGKNTLDVGAVNKKGQAEKCSVKPGWRVLGFKDKDCSDFAEFAAALDALRAAGETSCEVKFRTMNTTAVNKDPKKNRGSVFAPAGADGREAGAVIEGLLDKKASSISGAWQTRWFVARGHCKSAAFVNTLSRARRQLGIWPIGERDFRLG